MSTPKVINAKQILNVYERVFNVQQGIGTVVKNGNNDHFKYSFARERDIIAEVKPWLGKERIVITQSLIKEEEVEHGVTASGAKKFLSKLTFDFRVTNVDNPSDFFIGTGIGSGQDGEDKGIPKAYTMALKYFLSKTFLIETGDDTENTGGKKPADKGVDTFSRAKTMIAGTRNVDGLQEYAENVSGSKIFNAAQKKELLALCKARVDVLLK